jgi:hypothetical protein
VVHVVMVIKTLVHGGLDVVLMVVIDIDILIGVDLKVTVGFGVTSELLIEQILLWLLSCNR